MAIEASTGELLRRAIGAVKSSDVVESRAELISGLSDLDICERRDLCFLAENLITFWENFTCLDVSQCMLNKVILEVASKYVLSDKSGSVLTLFLALGTKASIWSRKHLQMTIMSMEESQEEEHSNIFYQLLLVLLHFSAASFSALTHCHTLEENVSSILENFSLEQLDLIKDLLEHIKRLESHSSEILKVSQLVIDSIVRFCGEQCEAINWDNLAKRPEDEKGSNDCDGPISVNPVTSIRKCVIGKLSDLGILASKDGGCLVGILNTSWKGVITLLQFGKGSVEAVLNVSDLILKLVSLAKSSLRSAAESWSFSSKEPISVAVARRAYVPVKFYLVNAVKISSLFPTQAFSAHREITLLAMMISEFRISISRERNLKIASEVLSELLEQTLMSLLYSILNSDELKEEKIFEILDSLFTDFCHDASHEDSCGKDIIQMEKIFSVTCDSISCAKRLLLGRILLLTCLLRSSTNAEVNVKVGVTSKLGWLFNMLVDEEVYACMLSMQIPLSYGTKEKTETVWMSIFCSLLEALKTFMIATSSSIAWGELISFLLDNIFHPHLLCSEIVMELLCFLMRYAENNVVNNVIDKLCSCFKSTACLRSALDPGSLARKIARAISVLIKCGAQSEADRVFSHVITGDRSQLSSVMLVGLLMEGFSLQLMSDKFREIARKRIISDYCGFIESFHGRLSGAGSSVLYGIPLFALSASLPSLQLNETDIDRKTLKFLFAIIGNLSESRDPNTQETCHMLLAETLGIVANTKSLYTSNEMEEVIVQLHSLFISNAASQPNQQRSKAALALFMAGLGHMEISGTEECRKSSALQGLYHMLLRERHWALVHLAIASFGYFAARTSCNQLWKFVPENAALSYDLLDGNKVMEEQFMCEFKAFLEKEMALSDTSHSSEQLLLLQEEAALLKQAVQKTVETLESEEMDIEVIEIDHEQLSSKRRKMPDGISKGVELLQDGLKVIGEGLSQWRKAQPDPSDLHNKFLTQFSCLEDAIANLASMTGSGCK